MASRGRRDLPRAFSPPPATPKRLGELVLLLGFWLPLNALRSSKLPRFSPPLTRVVDELLAVLPPWLSSDAAHRHAAAEHRDDIPRRALPVGPGAGSSALGEIDGRRAQVAWASGGLRERDARRGARRRGVHGDVCRALQRRAVGCARHDLPAHPRVGRAREPPAGGVGQHEPYAARLASCDDDDAAGDAPADVRCQEGLGVRVPWAHAGPERMLDNGGYVNPRARAGPSCVGSFDRRPTAVTTSYNCHDASNSISHCGPGAFARRASAVTRTTSSTSARAT